MAPKPNSVTGVLNEEEFEVYGDTIHPDVRIPTYRPLELVWKNIIITSFWHLGGIYGIYLIFTSASFYTSLFAFALYTMAHIGVCVGAHRLYSHRSFKAKWPLRLLLVFFHTIAFEITCFEWARDHRVHHKFSDTDADPYNASRGFFFSHIGWIMCKKHPDVNRKGKTIDFSDLYVDPFLMFQKKYFKILVPTFCFILPTVIPMYFWNETFTNAFYVNLARYILQINASFSINSVAHLGTSKPYDRAINPSEDLFVSLVTLGEGWHNYHHTFPWDYKASEFKNYMFNFSTVFIEFFAKIGWAYDLKTVDSALVKKRVLRTGDGTHAVWGWGDTDQRKEDRDAAIIR